MAKVHGMVIRYPTIMKGIFYIMFTIRTHGLITVPFGGNTIHPLTYDIQESLDVPLFGFGLKPHSWTDSDTK
jgi:hypothetical protein